jgi:hypothetical protein
LVTLLWRMLLRSGQRVAPDVAVIHLSCAAEVGPRYRVDIRKASTMV